MDADSNKQLLFASKQDVLASISQIYDSLIDITEEIDKLHTMLKTVEKNQNELILHISHLRSIISKDLTIRGVSPHMLTTTLRDLKMSQDQWKKYINSSTSPDDERENSDSASTRSKRSVDRTASIPDKFPCVEK